MNMQTRPNVPLFISVDYSSVTIRNHQNCSHQYVSFYCLLTHFDTPALASTGLMIRHCNESKLSAQWSIHCTQFREFIQEELLNQLWTAQRINVVPTTRQYQVSKLLACIWKHLTVLYCSHITQAPFLKNIVDSRLRQKADCRTCVYSASLTYLKWNKTTLSTSRQQNILEVLFLYHTVLSCQQFIDWSMQNQP
jgi:hypothetical protein